MPINWIVELSWSDNKRLTESNNLSGSIFSPTISRGNIDKSRQHWNTREFTFVVTEKHVFNKLSCAYLAYIVIYLQTICGAIRNLPSMVLIGESPRTFRNMTIHTLKISWRVVSNLWYKLWVSLDFKTSTHIVERPDDEH